MASTATTRTRSDGRRLEYPAPAGFGDDAHWQVSVEDAAGGAVRAIAMDEGFVVAGDGRAIRLTEAVESGFVVVVRRFERVGGDVLDFGAVGDGETDDTKALQAALRAAKEAGGGRVFVPGGTYRITDILKIGSGTQLVLAHDAVIVRGSNANAMLINDSDGTKGGFDASRNIVVQGGTWDANATTFPTQCCVIAFGHSSDIEVRDLTIRDVFEWHHIELNSTQRAKIVNCKLLDFVVGSRDSEAIQLDVSGGGFPWFGPIDSTPCRDIVIDRCDFLRQSRGVGTHTTVAGVWSENITISNCLFDDCALNGIYAVNWRRVNVTGCTFRNCGAEGLLAQNWMRVRVSGNDFWNCKVGAQFRTDGTTVCKQFVVDGNVFEDIGRGESTSAIRAIYFVGVTALWNLRDIVISNNTVEKSGNHGITADYCRGVTLTGNRVFSLTTGANSYGLACFGCRDVTVSGNSIDTVSHSGIFLSDTQNASVSGNTVCRTGSAGIIASAGSKHVAIAGNSVYETSSTSMFHNGISSSSSSFVTITGNTVADAGYGGIRLSSTVDSTVTGNFCTNSGSGVGGGAGIHLVTSDRNLLQGNTMRKGTKLTYGIWVQSGSDNVVINNDLLGGGNTSALQDAGTSTITTAGNRT